MLIKIIVCFFILLNSIDVIAANFALEIIQPQPSLTTHSRYYKAYPGIEYKVPIGVFGGSYPLAYALTVYPTGMTINNSTGIITWSNPTTDGSPHSVTVSVTDSESTTVTRSWTITVETTGFIFLSTSGNSSNDGTISSPLRYISDFLGDDSEVSTYNNYFVYFRGGTYGIDEGWFESCPGQQCKVHWRPGDRHPHVWLAYPGETVIIDHDLVVGDTEGAYISNENGDTDIFFGGIKFQDMLNHAIRSFGIRPVYFDCIFYNGGPGTSGDNPSFIMFEGSAQAAQPTYTFIKNCIFDTASGWAFAKFYSTYKTVVEGNIFQNPSGLTEGLALKAYDQYVSVRGNTFDGDFSAGSISGNWNQEGNFDISFNNIKNADGTYVAEPLDYGAITINHDNTVNGAVYIYRNTFDGTVLLKYGSTGTGPFSLYNNVIVNENASLDNPDGSLITKYNVSDASVLVLGTGDNANLVGASSDSIIDNDGKLSGSYRTTYLGLKGWETTDSTSQTISGGVTLSGASLQ